MTQSMIHRRAALAGLAAASIAGQAGLAATKGRGRRYIDVHNHYAAPAFVEFNRRFTPGSPALPWDMAGALADIVDRRKLLWVMNLWLAIA